LVSADTKSVCEAPTQSAVVLAGVWIVGGLLTTSTAALLVTLEPQLFETTTLYVAASELATEGILNVLEVALLIVTSFFNH
jgi:hypothetical protein